MRPKTRDKSGQAAKHGAAKKSSQRRDNTPWIHGLRTSAGEFRSSPTKKHRRPQCYKADRGGIALENVREAVPREHGLRADAREAEHGKAAVLDFLLLHDFELGVVVRKSHWIKKVVSRHATTSCEHLLHHDLRNGGG